ncbi:MAG: molybdopterin-dependent oxidoreductase [Campylobacterales bacterium]
MKLNGRRDFLKVSGLTATLVASQGSLFAKNVMKIENGKENYPNTSYTEEMYRNEFSFTFGHKEEHGFAYHCVNCQGNCAWEVWSHNGVVTRENQSARYPIINPKIPDFNPRGCNKGVQHSQVMYEKDRILYPMKRVGARGAGKWKRISWDEATQEIAQKIYDTMIDPKKGPGKIVCQAGTGLLTEGRRGAPLRFATQLGAVRIYPASYLGDMFSGATVAYGEGNMGCTYDFVYNSNVSIFWGANPDNTRIPDAHFVWEGKYNGGKVIVITPEFNASARHADLWVPIKAGTDNILAMSIIHEIIANKLYHPQFMKIYTDLPFLVRLDNKKLLRRSDMEHTEDHALHHKYEEQFYSWNLLENKPALMPGTEGSDKKTLRLKDTGYAIDPALEGRWKVKLHDGKEVEVTTVFELLKAEAAKFKAADTQKLTNVHPAVVSKLANLISKEKVVTITTGFALNKYFNGVLTIWNIASICGLTGRIGPRGGLNTENEFQLSGLDQLTSYAGKYRGRFGSGFLGEFMTGDMMNNFDKYFSDEDVKRGQGISKKEYKEILTAMIEAGREGADNPKNKGKAAKPFWIPEVVIAVADSRFRRNKGTEYRKAFFKKVTSFFYIDYRMSETAMYADIILPAKSHYEVWDIRSSPGYHRFANLAQPSAGLKPVGEAKDEWTIFAMIAEKLEKIAANGPVKKVEDKTHTKNGYRELDIFYKEFTNHDEESEGALEPYLGDDKMALEAALANCQQFEPYTIEKMYKMGGFLTLNEKAGKSAPLYNDKPYFTWENQLYKFERFETLSGRQTFYVDHDLWIKLGANVNTGRQGIRPNTKAYPFTIMTPHARWSIHANYKNSKTLLRLQRGMPWISINPDVAKIKGIKDGDTIRVYNKIGQFYAMAKVSSSAPHDCLVIEDGWEPNMFKNLRGPNDCVPPSLNLLEMADGWGHLKFGGNWDGNQYAYDGAVNFEKAPKA